MSTSRLPVSGWSGLLNKAVESLESRLDRVLDAPMPPEERLNAKEQAQRDSSVDLSGSSLTRLSMQERLAAAVAAKSRTATPAAGASSNIQGRAQSVQASDQSDLVFLEFNCDPAMNAFICVRLSCPLHITPLPIPELQGMLPNSEAPKNDEQSLKWRVAELEKKLVSLCEYLRESSLEAMAKMDRGSLEYKLAEKDDQIATLLAEGERLSKTEFKNMTIIKSLRSKSNENISILNEAKQRQESAERDIANLRAQVKRLGDSERKQSDRIKTLVRTESALLSMREERDSARNIVNKLQSEIKRLKALADEAKFNAQSEALKNEKLETEKLRRELSEHIAKSNATERALRSEIAAITLQRDRELEEKNNIIELNVKEISRLELKLEATRSTLEEAIAPDKSRLDDTTARQFELLQSQHFIAKQDWQQVEADLTHKIHSLVRERDEAQRKLEQEQRNFIPLNEQLQSLKNERSSLEGQLDKTNSKCELIILEAEDLRQALEQMRMRFDELRKSFAKERELLESVIESRVAAEVEEERSKWLSEIKQEARDVSPPPVTHSPHPGQRVSGTISREVFLNETLSPSPKGYKFDQLRSLSPRPASLQHNASETESETGWADSLLSIASPTELISNMRNGWSSSGGGRTLLDHLTVSVKRLEVELLQTREEAAKLVKDRSEMHKQIELLQTQLQAREVLEVQLGALREEYTKLNERYQGALEMLGEKSERESELLLDISDLKLALHQAIKDLTANDRNK